MNTNQSLSDLTPEATISQIIEANDQAGQLLTSIGLSVSQHKSETLRSVCKQHKWSEAEVLQWVKKHSLSTNGKNGNSVSRILPGTNDSLTKWTRYLEDKLINPNLSLLDELKQSFPRIHKIHGNQYPWLKMCTGILKNLTKCLGCITSLNAKSYFLLLHGFQTRKTEL